MVQISPTRVYNGQLPLYDGGPGGKLIDPKGGVEGRYKFPQGTPRGIDRGKAMLADIEQNRLLVARRSHRQLMLVEE